MATADFGKRLKIALEMRGMKQSELAEKAHIDKTLITAYIKGRYKAKADKLYALAKALNVSEAWLMGLDVPLERKPTANGSGRSEEFVELFGKLTAEQQDFIIASIKGLLQSR
ncbi:MAG: helix-turn-helix transcriptional regulator [Clostridia bacterium]|nr:helix-turn-helix transcriptional regulator [Clostridia bacterium]